ncbi:hypothetical protein [Fluviicola sp.]|uniref:hypothetical protein n=1 Tax=Fluviicola sp. TaxID=1917219 RepID=UPI003D2926E6
MKRKQLFEFEDQSWFPGFLRNYLTDFLQFISNQFDIYKAITPLLSEAIENSGEQRIIDLASGGGGGLFKLSKRLEEKHPNLEIVLTDYYPNLKAFEYVSKQATNFKYETKPVDARNVPGQLKGVRTQFLSLHHFKEEDAVQILQNAVDSKSSIAIFESQERNVKSVLAMIFSPINVLLMTPFIRPFSVGRIVFTYLIPLVPLFVLLDGILSALRTYTIPEMNELISRVKGHENFDWKVGRQKSGPASILYLIGSPK